MSIINDILEYIKEGSTTKQKIIEHTKYTKRQVDPVLSILKRKKDIIITSSGIIKSSIKSINHKEKDKIQKTKLTEKEIFNTMTSEDQSRFLAMEQQIQFLSASKEALIKSYYAVLSLSRSYR